MPILSRHAWLGVLMTVAGSMGAAQGAELKIATVAPEGSGWMKDLRATAAEIASRTDQRVTLKLYGGGVQGPDRKVLRKMRIGQLQGATFTTSGLADLYPDIVIYGLPLLFRSQAEVDHVRRRVDPLLAAGLEEAGFVTFGFAGTGFGRILSNTPVTRPADLAGRKMWVPEGDRTSFIAMNRLGLAPVVLPITDVMTGLQTNLVEVLAAPPAGAVILQWHTRTRYLSEVPLAYGINFLAVDREAFGRLAPADQRVVREVMEPAFRRLDIKSREDNKAAEQAMLAAGIQAVKADPAALPEWQRRVEESYGDMVREGIVSAELLATVRSELLAFRGEREAPRTAAR